MGIQKKMFRHYAGLYIKDLSKHQVGHKALEDWNFGYIHINKFLSSHCLARM